MPQNETPPNTGYSTQANEFKFGYEGSSIVTPGQAKPLHSVLTAPSAEHAPGREIKEQALRKKRLSFGGGNDGRGSPMFANLENVRGRHMADGYNDQKPPDGFIGAAFKRFINAGTGATVYGGK